MSCGSVGNVVGGSSAPWVVAAAELPCHHRSRRCYSSPLRVASWKGSRAFLHLRNLTRPGEKTMAVGTIRSAPELLEPGPSAMSS